MGLPRWHTWQVGRDLWDRPIGACRFALRLALLFATLFALPLLADRVAWSDGQSADGRIRTGGDGRVRLHDGARLREWSLPELAALTCEPATQRMERAWRFIEAGKTAKEFHGEPYPVIELEARATLRDGRVVPGHLMTSVFYIESGDTTRKLVIRHQLKGQPGQGFGDLVYPCRMEFADPAVATLPTLRVQVEALAGCQPELAWVWRSPATVAGRVTRTEPGVFSVEIDGADPVIALRDGLSIAVGWPGSGDATLRARLAQGIADVKDFFDDRRLLAVASNATDVTVAYSLVLVSRAGRTTLAAAASQPWRLEVWRWRLGEGPDVLLAARAVMYRDIRAPNAPLPTVAQDPQIRPGAAAAALELVWRWNELQPLQPIAPVPAGATGPAPRP